MTKWTYVLHAQLEEMDYFNKGRTLQVTLNPRFILTGSQYSGEDERSHLGLFGRPHTYRT